MADGRAAARIILDDTAFRLGYRLSWLANFYSGPIYRRLQMLHGLTRHEFLVLFCLAHVPGIAAAEICAATGRPKNSISRAVGRLLRDRRIVRHADPSDGRAIILDLTPQGRSFHDAMMQELSAREAKMLAPLTTAEREQLDRLLGKLVHRDDDWADTF
ncbi:MAG: MarR family transcriptional regulator [Alphaproteobacteria bacterium]|nr:MarR family transcriptional regulator [Alphaproteobacteria bacterium]